MKQSNDGTSLLVIGDGLCIIASIDIWKFIKMNVYVCKRVRASWVLNLKYI